MNQRRKRALITGITGQDGSYLSELLLDKGYEVHGIIRRSSSFNTGRIDHIFDKLQLHYGDLTDSLSVDKIVKAVKPDEIYNLGAQSHVHVSFQIPKYTAETDGMGTLYLLESMREHCPSAKFYNATTSELYGKVQETPQNEDTPFYPRSPYGVAKLYSYWITKNYKEAYDLFTVNGVLFNHESPRRGGTFVTKKIVRGITHYLNTGEPFFLGNVEAKRDWGHAREFVRGMWMMLQQDEPNDYVLATGETHTIKDFVNECLKHFENSFEWSKDQKARDILVDGDRLVIGIDERYYRPAEVELLHGDPTRAKRELGWEPRTKFKDLVKEMMEWELQNYVPNPVT